MNTPAYKHHTGDAVQPAKLPFAALKLISDPYEKPQVDLREQWGLA